jgi:hypothetical protein
LIKRSEEYQYGREGEERKGWINIIYNTGGWGNACKSLVE